MAINKDLNAELDLETLGTAVGGPIKAADLPKKFKTGPAFRESMQEKTEAPKDPTEEEEAFLKTVYGGPINAEDLPESYYTSKDDNIRH